MNTPLKSPKFYTNPLIPVTAFLMALILPSAIYAANGAPHKATIEEIAEAYKIRYGVSDTFTKVTDNRGDGFEDLYGTRNFRVVLHGFLYRGGANNKFHRENKRDNMNPLPNDGLQNLCEEGFAKSVYLYSENYKTAPPKVQCGDPKTPHTLYYDQQSPLDLSNVKNMLKAVHTNIKNANPHPTYFHCWNGWHASGLISSYALIQFCDLSNEDAVSYWNKHTDGYDDEPGFEKIRKRIRDFKPDPALRLTKSERTTICPSDIVFDSPK